MLPADKADAPLFERLREGLGRRTTGLVLALLLEALLILLLLTLSQGRNPEAPLAEIVSTFDASSKEEAAEPAETPEAPEDQPSPTVQPSAVPSETPPDVPAPVEPQPVPTPAAIIPLRPSQLDRADISQVPKPPARPAEPAGPAYGPVGSSARPGDSRRVGTAPNGQPMYAASWYRKPYDIELRGYLSTAQHPGWGIIACQTAPDYRVENCVAVDEYPDNSNYARAVLAASWQFKVRPPRIGGRNVIGAWVRIKIYDEYENTGVE